MRATVAKQYRDTPVDVKHKLSALWVTMLFVFAYVDIFGFYRADVLNAALHGKIEATGLTINQMFLTAALVYILLPSLMVSLTLILRPRANRAINIAVSILYTVSILASCIGETWIYYLAGSAVETVLLLAITRTAWRWPLAQVETPLTTRVSPHVGNVGQRSDVRSQA